MNPKAWVGKKKVRRWRRVFVTLKRPRFPDVEWVTFYEPFWLRTHREDIVTPKALVGEKPVRGWRRVFVTLKRPRFPDGVMLVRRDGICSPGAPRHHW